MDWDFLSRELGRNEVREYLAAGVTFALVLAAFLIGRRVLIKRLKDLAQRTTTDIDDLAVELLGRVRFPEAFIIAFWAATRPLVLPGWADRGLKTIVLLTVGYRVITILQGVASYAISRSVLKAGAPSAADRNAARNLGYAASALIWLGGLLFVLSNLGVNITSFVAGLGIGGVAVALAAQAVLGDLFSALAIYLDKPFVVGDFIVVDALGGTVESVGIKTTRVRALSGELYVFPNSNLTSSRIRNFQDLSERRVVVKFSAAHGTPVDRLERVPGLLKEAVSSRVDCRFDRAHLAGLGDSSVDFELVYYFLGADFNLHMDAQQAVILHALRGLEREGVEVPFPRTVRLLEARKP